jgi:hypothetical protein
METKRRQAKLINKQRHCCVYVVQRFFKKLCEKHLNRTTKLLI